jgi:uncharacterized protein YjbJ (UPF0337 family)
MDDISKPNSPTSKNDATIGSVASDIKDAAAKKFDEAKSDVRSKAHDAKDGVAEQVKDVANALRRASEELRGGSPQERTLGMLAGGLADVSDQIRDKDLGEMAQVVSRVARENPVLFLSGAALLGFAISRYAKATASHTEQSRPKTGTRPSAAYAAESGAGATKDRSAQSNVSMSDKEWPAPPSGTMS